MTPCVLLATPSYERRPCVDYFLSLSATEEALQQAGIRSLMSFLSGSAYISASRNAFAAVVLRNPDITDLFFIDDDVGWPAAKVVEFIRRPEAVVAGVYPKKSAEGFPVSLQRTDDGKPIQQDGLLLADIIPAGFLRIKRHVLERLASLVQSYETDQGPAWALFEARVATPEQIVSPILQGEALVRAIDDLRRLFGKAAAKFVGEDVWFAAQWQALGGECWIDPDIEFSHSGHVKVLGNYAKSLTATGEL